MKVSGSSEQKCCWKREHKTVREIKLSTHKSLYSPHLLSLARALMFSRPLARSLTLLKSINSFIHPSIHPWPMPHATVILLKNYRVAKQLAVRGEKIKYKKLPVDWTEMQFEDI
jgi:hypothetical protein